MGLFDVVYHGSDEMYFKAEAAVKETIEKIGENAPVSFGNTAYYLACIKAYTALEVTNMAQLRDALVPIRAMMTRNNRTADIFHSGIATAMAAEVIEACKYARTPTPYENTQYHGHFSDAEVRERYSGAIRMSGRMADALSDDLGNYFYMARFGTEAELEEFVSFVQTQA